MVVFVSCGVNNYIENNHRDCTYSNSRYIVNDTVYVQTIHNHIVYKCHNYDKSFEYQWIIIP